MFNNDDKMMMNGEYEFASPLFCEQPLLQLVDIPAYTPSLAPPTPVLKRKRASHLTGTPPRPPNAFMIFRQEFMADLVYDRSEYQKELDGINEKDKKSRSSFWTRVASKEWNEAPTEMRKLYHAKAHEKKREHAIKYPDYQYTPQRRTPAKSATKKTTRKSPYERYSEPAGSPESTWSAESSSSPEPTHPLYLSSPTESFNNQLYLPDEFNVPAPAPSYYYAGETRRTVSMDSSVTSTFEQYNAVDSMVDALMGEYFNLDPTLVSL